MPNRREPFGIEHFDPKRRVATIVDESRERLALVTDGIVANLAAVRKIGTGEQTAEEVIAEMAKPKSSATNS